MVLRPLGLSELVAQTRSEVEHLWPSTPRLERGASMFLARGTRLVLSVSSRARVGAEALAGEDMLVVTDASHF